ncbi:MAG TPA: LON peptidase substrate-binding domain-containing protein [Giesbergeria sp.]|nr:LON peptidase substrate-binding domain-containing protein [Giesbergeria sp.]HNE71493.1 LON peptidase substrate-binding domain-containing protein [Giesbergeria sp.]HNI77064.1 LON peptidase substrate-binding domain-containing protein [Giesbergeria sp.]HNK06011.1 LON peptidase substrate-binding domain-containing protein [Giesbergeria sp.]HNN17241.1 LON peptidase substrate-binding domain-containing protein [Giesbergeria sp.]
MPQPLTLTSLPLFPLAAVLLPGGHLALRVFEVRYLDMVRKCQQAGAPFGVVCLRSGSEVRKAGAPQEQLHAVGTLARITQLQSPQPALIHLECEGTQRFHIQRSHVLPHGLWVADVQLLPADHPTAVPPHLMVASAALARVLASLPERPGHRSTPQPTANQLGDCGWVANRWCELLPVPQELKQQLMQLDNPLVRLELVADVLDRTGIARA